MTISGIVKVDETFCIPLQEVDKEALDLENGDILGFTAWIVKKRSLSEKECIEQLLELRFTPIDSKK